MSEEVVEMPSNDDTIITKNVDVEIYIYREDERAKIPKVAYNGTSSSFDLTCIVDTVIPAGGSAIIPNGLRISIDQESPYWMNIQLRSSLGFMKDLIPHYGNVDAGYTGPFGVKVYNVGKEDVTIKAGERYAQVAVLWKPDYAIKELTAEQFEELVQNQQRGNNGFGSSGKN